MRVFKSEDIGKMAYVSSDFLNQVMDELLKSMVNKKGTDEIVEIFGRKAFSYPKNELLMQRIIEYITKEEDIVLDFHLGSGTTAAVAHKMSKQYIGNRANGLWPKRFPLNDCKQSPSLVSKAVSLRLSTGRAAGISSIAN